MQSQYTFDRTNVKSPLCTEYMQDTNASHHLFWKLSFMMAKPNRAPKSTVKPTTAAATPPSQLCLKAEAVGVLDVRLHGPVVVVHLRQEVAEL